MAEKVKDLVCGMEFDREEASATFEHKGKTYYFCNPGCKERFAADPEKHIAREKKG
jgi:Cu+-exporting ATPase